MPQGSTCSSMALGPPREMRCMSYSLVRKCDLSIQDPAPDVAESELNQGMRILALEALVTMKLTSFRDQDRTHLRDMLSVGLIDASWTSQLPGELASRLQHLLDHPHG
jgi:hypothetical protein